MYKKKLNSLNVRIDNMLPKYSLYGGHPVCTKNLWLQCLLSPPPFLYCSLLCRGPVNYYSVDPDPAPYR